MSRTLTNQSTTEDHSSDELWNPFPEIDVDFQDFDDGIAKFLNAHTWELKFDVHVDNIMAKFLRERISKDPDYDRWPQLELTEILDDAKGGIPKKRIPFREPTRYFCSGKDEHEVSDCEHEGESGCFCHFEAKITAGIPKFPTDYESGKARKEALRFMRNLCVQLLIILTNCVTEYLGSSNRKTMVKFNDFVNPNRHTNAEQINKTRAEIESEESIRCDYLFYDSWLETFEEAPSEDIDVSSRGANEGNSTPYRTSVQIRPDSVPTLLRLCGTLGRRVLALEVCIVGNGFIFARKEPIQFFSFKGIVHDFRHTVPIKNANDYHRTNPRSYIEKRYPTRVINTQILEFEEDQMLFRKSYAILSHTWKGREVTYAAAKSVLSEYKAESVIRRNIFKVE
jgi:hypothetical protein